MDDRKARSEDLSIFRIIVKKYHEFEKKELSDYSFTPNEISTMIYLRENSDIDTAKQISDKFAVTQSLICRSVDSLIKKGYLTAETDKDDRRVNHLTLHIEDENLMNKLDNLNSRYLDKLFKGIPDSEQMQFRDTLNKILGNIK